MVNLYQVAKRDLGYNATRFLQMLTEVGGVEAARQLLRAPSISDGFTALWERGRLDLTVEAQVLLPDHEACSATLNAGRRSGGWRTMATSADA
jgi:hypothetical protein